MLWPLNKLYRSVSHVTVCSWLLYRLCYFPLAWAYEVMHVVSHMHVCMHQFACRYSHWLVSMLFYHSSSVSTYSVWMCTSMKFVLFLPPIHPCPSLPPAGLTGHLCEYLIVNFIHDSSIIFIVCEIIFIVCDWAVCVLYNYIHCMSECIHSSGYVIHDVCS